MNESSSQLATENRLCSNCGQKLELSVVDLGTMPPANSFYLPDETPPQSNSLHAVVCESCWLVQLDCFVDAEQIFTHDYAYLSSYSSSWVEHGRKYAQAVTKRFRLSEDSLVVEIASNDGYLLDSFKQLSIPVLGVEPTAMSASLAQQKGIDTRVEFFNVQTATQLRSEKVVADLMVANNVLAHVPDIKGFLAGFPVLLAGNGVLTFEFPHLLNLLDKVQFDTIYHEHYYYLSLYAVSNMLTQFGLRVFDVETLPTHGGSLRVYACHEDADHVCGDSVASIAAAEQRAGLTTASAYRKFADQVGKVVEQFKQYVGQARAASAVVAGYGAAAKASTLLNVCGMDASDIAFIADANEQKQGRLLPGSQVPIVSPERLLETKPDHVVIFPWNLKDEICALLSPLRSGNTRFVIVAQQVQEL